MNLVFAKHNSFFLKKIKYLEKNKISGSIKLEKKNGPRIGSSQTKIVR